MTADEHKLIVMVLARQAVVIRALSDALVQKGVLEKDDVPAYGALLDSDRDALIAITHKTRELYKDCALVLGLETGL